MAGAVDFLDYDVQEDQDVDSNIEGYEAKEATGKLVARLSLFHEVSIVEHQPDANEHDCFIKYLDEIVQPINHWAHHNQVGQKDCAEDVSYCDLQYDR